MSSYPERAVLAGEVHAVRYIPDLRARTTACGLHVPTTTLLRGPAAGTVTCTTCQQTTT